MNLYEHHISTKSAQQMTKVTNMVREDIKRAASWRESLLYSLPTQRQDLQ